MGMPSAPSAPPPSPAPAAPVEERPTDETDIRRRQAQAQRGRRSGVTTLKDAAATAQKTLLGQ